MSGCEAGAPPKGPIEPWTLVGLTAPVFDLGLKGRLDSHGTPSFETQFSLRDLILIAGGFGVSSSAPSTRCSRRSVQPAPA